MATITHDEMQKLVAEFRETHAKFCRTLTSYRKWMRRASCSRDLQAIVVDTETSGLDPWSGRPGIMDLDTGIVSIPDTYGAMPFSVQLGLDFGDKLIILFAFLKDLTEADMALLKRVLSRPKVMKIGHNLKFDIQMLRKVGVRVALPWFDTLAATRLTHDREFSHSLKNLYCRFTGLKDKWDAPVKAALRRLKSSHTRAGHPKGYVNYSFVPKDLIIPYGMEDIFSAYILYRLVKPEIDEDYKYIFKVEMEMLRVVMDMELRGIHVDRKECKNAIAILNKKINFFRHNISRFARKHGMPDFNPSSPKQLHALLDNIGIPDEDRTYRGEITLQKKVINKIIEKYGKSVRVLRYIQQLRTARKLHTAYFGMLLNKRRHSEDHRVHCNFRPSDTSTGRSACTDPNLQQIPRPDSAVIEGVPTVRRVIVPTPGYTMWFLDYSQIEMRNFALFAQEEDMLAVLKAGGDLHLETARMMYNRDPEPKDRQNAKAINFGIVYGMAYKGLALQLGCSQSQAKREMNNYLTRFPGVPRLQYVSKNRLHNLGYAEDMFGKRYHVPYDRSYIIVNSLIQGSSANVLKYALVQTRRFLRVSGFNKQTHQLLQIHDEQVLETHPDVPVEVVVAVKYAMEEVLPILQYDFRNPVEVSMSTANWEAKQKVTFSKAELRAGHRLFMRHYDQVVIPLSIDKTEWFLR